MEDYNTCKYLFDLPLHSNPFINDVSLLMSLPIGSIASIPLGELDSPCVHFMALIDSTSASRSPEK